MPAAPLPQNGTNGVNGHEPSLEESGETLEIKAEIRDTLAKVRERSRTGRLQEDSRLFRMKQKLTEIATTEDADRRRQYLREAGLTTQVDYGDDEPEPATADSGVSRIPDPIED